MLMHLSLICTLWREQDSNLRPLGYEPNELPLLHPAVSLQVQNYYKMPPLSMFKALK